MGWARLQGREDEGLSASSDPEKKWVRLRSLSLQHTVTCLGITFARNSDALPFSVVVIVHRGQNQLTDVYYGLWFQGVRVLHGEDSMVVGNQTRKM